MCAGERTQIVASRLSGAQPEERRSPSPIPPPRGCGEGVKNGCLVSAGCGSKCSLTHTATFGTRSAGASDLQARRAYLYEVNVAEVVMIHQVPVKFILGLFLGRYKIANCSLEGTIYGFLVAAGGSMCAYGEIG